MKAKLFIILLIFISISIYSQERVDESTLKIGTEAVAPTPNTPIITTVGIRDYLVMIFVLIMVIILLYFVLKVVKKLGGARLGIDNDLINVLSTKALKGTTALHLVEVGSHIFLIGATDGSINRIGEITDKESKDAIVLQSSTENNSTESFIQILTNKLKKGNIQSESEDQAPSEVQSQKEKLDRF